MGAAKQGALNCTCGTGLDFVHNGILRHQNLSALFLFEKHDQNCFEILFPRKRAEATVALILTRQEITTVKPKRWHRFLKFICFEVALYMFRTVVPSIIRSLRL